MRLTQITGFIFAVELREFLCALGVSTSFMSVCDFGTYQQVLSSRPLQPPSLPPAWVSSSLLSNIAKNSHYKRSTWFCSKKAGGWGFLLCCKRTELQNLCCDKLALVKPGRDAVQVHGKKGFFIAIFLTSLDELAIGYEAQLCSLITLFPVLGTLDTDKIPSEDTFPVPQAQLLPHLPFGGITLRNS